MLLAGLCRDTIPPASKRDHVGGCEHVHRPAVPYESAASEVVARPASVHVKAGNCLRRCGRGYVGDPYSGRSSPGLEGLGVEGGPYKIGLCHIVVADLG